MTRAAVDWNELCAVIAHLAASQTVLTHPLGPTTAPATTPPARQSLKKIVGPEPYDGSQEGLHTFRNQLGLALIDRKRFSDEQYRLRHCFQLLKGETFTTVQPFLTPADHIEFEMAEAYLGELTRIFGDFRRGRHGSRVLEILNRAIGSSPITMPTLSTSLLSWGIMIRPKGTPWKRGLSAEIIESLRHQSTPGSEALARYEYRPNDSIRRSKGLSKPRPHSVRLQIGQRHSEDGYPGVSWLWE